MKPPAGAGMDERELQRQGRDFLAAAAGAIRALQLYPLENQAVGKALAELDAATDHLLASESEIGVRYVGDFFFVNDVRLRVDLSSYASFTTVGRALQRHGIGQLEVFRGASAQEWTAFLSLVSQEGRGADPFTAFLERLGHSPVFHITVGPDRSGAAEQDEDALRMAKRAYAQTVAVARECMTGLRLGRGASLRPVKRAVQSIVDQVLRNETSIVGLTTLHDYDEYTFVHSVNVCIFSVALGKKLGFDKHQLYELGLGALLHDVGKVRMPVELINKPGPLSREEFEVLKEHPTEGLLALFDLRGLGELPLRAMLMAYEHHLKVDGSGYPKSIRPRESSLFARMVAVADGFDAATSQRAYAPAGLPDEVLRQMREDPRYGFDPLLVKAFVSMTGIYPVGTVVILDTHEIAVVHQRNPRPDALHQPLVKVVFDALGTPLDPPRLVDLSEPDPATGAPVATIIKTTDPERYGLNPGDYFV
ncbi:MAG TPA: HD-GYP domain-containing protein [Longimicrobium sp.]|nr:HD-GYP domain-containing protein [Longimicrobium sp.]